MLVPIGGITMRFLISIFPIRVGSNNFLSSGAVFNCAPPEILFTKYFRLPSLDQRVFSKCLDVWIFYMLAGPVFQPGRAQSALGMWDARGCNPEQDSHFDVDTLQRKRSE